MSNPGGKPKPAFFIAVLVIVAGLGGFAFYRYKGKSSDTTDTPTTNTPTKPDVKPAGPTVEITFEYSTEKKDWLEAAVADFEKANPGIHVTLIGKGSLESKDAILDGTDQPVLWSPADSLVANLMAADWQTKTGKSLYASPPEPLLLSPLVFAVWEDRAKVLVDGTNGQLSWKTIHKAVVSPKGWPAIGGQPGWGFVKLGHTDPSRSNSGLQAVLLMAIE